MKVALNTITNTKSTVNHYFVKTQQNPNKIPSHFDRQQVVSTYPKAYYIMSFGSSEQQDNKKTLTKLEWAKSWNYEKRKEELNAETEKAISAMSYWKRNLSRAPQKLRETASIKLESEQKEVTTILQLAADIQGKIDDLTQKAQQDEETIRLIKKEKQKLADLNTIQDTLSKFKTNEGGLDDVIAGYDAEKELLRTKFIKPLAIEKIQLAKGEKPIKIPPSVLLYGAIGTGKSTFARAIGNETGCKVIEITPRVEDFSKDVLKYFLEAKTRYLKTGQRTIIIVNEIDKYLKDVETNDDNIGILKNSLDNCSKLPGLGIDNANATSFIFTTNHPLKMTDEILYRDGKLPIKLALEPASEDNFKEVLKFYIKQADAQKQYFDYENIDYNKLLEKFKPDMQKGAYSNDKLRSIVQKTYQSYLMNQEIPFEDQLDERFEKTKRDIKPHRLEQYYKDLEELDEE